jgi:hypothetical protein
VASTAWCVAKPRHINARRRVDTARRDFVRHGVVRCGAMAEDVTGIIKLQFETGAGWDETLRIVQQWRLETFDERQLALTACLLLYKNNWGIERWAPQVPITQQEILSVSVKYKNKIKAPLVFTGVNEALMFVYYYFALISSDPTKLFRKTTEIIHTYSISDAFSAILRISKPRFVLTSRDLRLQVKSAIIPPDFSEKLAFDEFFIDVCRCVDQKFSGTYKEAPNPLGSNLAYITQLMFDFDRELKQTGILTKEKLAFLSQFQRYVEEEEKTVKPSQIRSTSFLLDMA